MKLKIDLNKTQTVNGLYFTSDLHLFHRNVIKFDQRPFNNIEEMHAAIIERWNSTVGENDYVINLGDLSFAKSTDQDTLNEILSKLNGRHYFVMGNHDMFKDIKRLPRIEGISDYLEIKLVSYDLVKKQLVEQLFCCMHYPLYSWNKMHHGSYLVHGHCHGQLYAEEQGAFYKNRRAIDVGCMLHDYTPISYLKIIDHLKDRIIPIYPPKESVTFNN